eukprot:1150907-Pelagomonas_calceolata.AAC.2
MRAQKSKEAEKGVPPWQASSSASLPLAIKWARYMLLNFVISKARVPIIKFETVKHGGLAFDVSFDVANGPQAAELVREFTGDWPMMRPLVLVLKLFLQQRELNEVSLVLVLKLFLQHRELNEICLMLIWLDAVLQELNKIRSMLIRDMAGCGAGTKCGWCWCSCCFLQQELNKIWLMLIRDMVGCGAAEGAERGMVDAGTRANPLGDSPAGCVSTQTQLASCPRPFDQDAFCLARLARLAMPCFNAPVYTGGIGSYALITMIGAFLQLHNSRVPRQPANTKKGIEEDALLVWRA